MNTAAIKDRLSRVWTYRWSVTLGGRRYDLRLESHWTSNTFIVMSEGAPIARDVLRFYSEPFRMQEVVVEGASGSTLTFRAAPRNLWAYGFEVAQDGAVVSRSHTEPFAGLEMMRKICTFGESAESRAKTLNGKGAGNKDLYPVIVADVCIGLLLYIAAGYMSLRYTAILGAAAVLLLMLVEWSADRLFGRKINLTGGLAGFGVLMLLLSAGFAWIVENELAIMLKSSVLGMIAAVLLAIDAMLGGKYLGQRMGQFITFVDLDPRRFSWGSSMAAAGQSLLSAAIAIWLSRDAWLLYKHWVGPTLGLALGIVVLWKSRRQSMHQLTA
jgi:intracellular septation protein